MLLGTPSPLRDTPLEHLAGSAERVTFHSGETAFCGLCGKFHRRPFEV
jgi:hypothetical protein